MVGVGFEDGSFLNSPPREAPDLSFPSTGGLWASISPPHSECQMDLTRSRSRPHPAAPIGSCKRMGGAPSHPPALPGAVTGQGATHGHPTPEQL